MEDIEYLEEYEDMVLPTIQTKRKENVTQRGNSDDTDDDDSSSIDQDIFETIFDDQSDEAEDLIPTPEIDKRTLQQKRKDRDSIDSIDLLVKDLGITGPKQPLTKSTPLINKKTEMQNALKPTTSRAAQKVDAINMKVTTPVDVAKRAPIRMPPLKKDVPKTNQKIANITAKTVPIRNQPLAVPKPKMTTPTLQPKYNVANKKAVAAAATSTPTTASAAGAGAAATAAASASASASVKELTKKNNNPLSEDAKPNKEEDENFYYSSDDSYDDLSGIEDDIYLDDTDFDSDLSDLSDISDSSSNDFESVATPTTKKLTEKINSDVSKVIEKTLPKKLPFDNSKNATKKLPLDNSKNGTKKLPLVNSKNGTKKLPLDNSKNGTKKLPLDNSKNATKKLPLVNSKNGKQKLPLDNSKNGAKLLLDSSKNSRNKLSLDNSKNVTKAPSTSACKTTVDTEKKANENTKTSQSDRTDNYNEIAELERELNLLISNDPIPVNNERPKGSKDDEDQQIKKNMVIADSTTLDDNSQSNENAINKKRVLEDDDNQSKIQLQNKNSKGKAENNKTTDNKSGSVNKDEGNKLEKELSVKAAVVINNENNKKPMDKKNETNKEKGDDNIGKKNDAQESKTVNIDKSKNIVQSTKCSSVGTPKKVHFATETTTAENTNKESLTIVIGKKISTNSPKLEEKQSLKIMQKNASPYQKHRNAELEKAQSKNSKAIPSITKIINKSTSPIRSKITNSSALENLDNSSATNDKKFENLSPKKSTNDIETAVKAISPNSKIINKSTAPIKSSALENVNDSSGCSNKTEKTSPKKLNAIEKVSPTVVQPTLNVAKTFEIGKYKIPKISSKQGESATSDKTLSPVKKPDDAPVTNKTPALNEVRTKTTEKKEEETPKKQTPEIIDIDSEETTLPSNETENKTLTVPTNVQQNNTDMSPEISTKKQATPDLILPIPNNENLSIVLKNSTDDKQQEKPNKSTNQEQVVSNNQISNTEETKLPSNIAPLENENKHEKDKNNEIETTKEIPPVSKIPNVEQTSDEKNVQESEINNKEKEEKQDLTEPQPIIENILEEMPKKGKRGRKRTHPYVQIKLIPKRTKRISKDKDIGKESTSNTPVPNSPKTEPLENEVSHRTGSARNKSPRLKQQDNDTETFRKSPRLIKEKNKNIVEKSNDLTAGEVMLVERPTSKNEHLRNRRISQEKATKQNNNEENNEQRKEPLEALKSALIAQKMKNLGKKDSILCKKILLKASANENAEAFKGNWFNVRIKLNRSTVPRYFQKLKAAKEFPKTNIRALRTRTERSAEDQKVCLDAEQQIKATTLVKSPVSRELLNQTTGTTPTTGGIITSTAAFEIKQPKLPMITGPAQVFTIPPQHRRAPSIELTTADISNNVEPPVSSTHSVVPDTAEVLDKSPQPVEVTSSIRKSSRPHKRKILSPTVITDDEDYEPNNLDKNKTKTEEQKSYQNMAKKTRYQLKKDNIQTTQQATPVTLPTLSNTTATTATTSAASSTPKVSNNSVNATSITAAESPLPIQDRTQYYSFRKHFKSKANLLDDLNYALVPTNANLPRKTPNVTTTKVLELPAFISMTTKLITRANLNDKKIPEKIRKQFCSQRGLTRPALPNISSLKSAGASVVPSVGEIAIKMQQRTTPIQSEIGAMRQTMRKCTLLMQEFKYSHPKLSLIQQRMSVEQLIRLPGVKPSDVTCMHDVLEKYVKIIKSQALNTVVKQQSTNDLVTVTKSTTTAAAAATTATPPQLEQRNLLARQVNIRTDGVVLRNTRTRNMPVSPALNNPLEQQETVRRVTRTIRRSMPAQTTQNVLINLTSPKQSGDNQTTATVVENVVVYKGDKTIESSQTSQEESILPDYQVSKGVINIKNENIGEDDIIGN